MRTISAPTSTIENAIIASTGAEGNVAQPSVAKASVIECATVNAVTVFTSMRQSRTISISEATNNRWSKPNRICSMPLTI